MTRKLRVHDLGVLRRCERCAQELERRHQDGSESPLEEKGIGAAGLRRLAIGVFGVPGHDNDLALGALCLAPPQDLQAVDPRHAEVQEQDIRPEFLSESHRLGTVRRLADYVAVGLRGHDLPQEHAELRVIIDNQDGHRHRLYPCSPQFAPPSPQDHIRQDKL